jgi:hypothetical protein
VSSGYAPKEKSLTKPPERRLKLFKQRPKHELDHVMSWARWVVQVLSMVPQRKKRTKGHAKYVKYHKKDRQCLKQGVTARVTLDGKITCENS